MQPGIPTQDIIWPNIQKILLVERFKRIQAFYKPLILSVLTLVFFLCVEKILETHLPLIAPFLLQVTITIISLIHICGTPWFVYQSVISEQHWRKSTRETLYTTRLFVIMFFNVILVPIVFSGIYSTMSKSQSSSQTFINISFLQNT